MKKKLRSVSARATEEFAASCAREILKKRLRTRSGAFVVGLIGDLGAGKTTFVRGFLKGLGVRGRVVSPTFLILRRYSNVYHIDAYRIHRASELLPLGFKEIIKNQKNIVVIEWADKIRRALPPSTLWIRFSHGVHDKERIIIHENTSSY